MKRLLSDVLSPVAPKAIVEVFDSYGVRLRELSAAPPPPRSSFAPSGRVSQSLAAGVIGFTGPTLRGTLMVASTFHLLDRARPREVKKRPLSEDSAADWILVRDWVRELSNQILGRIKNRLRAYDVTFDVSPPLALSGRALAFATAKGPAPQYCLFSSNDQNVWSCFDAIFDPKYEVEPTTELDGGTEGKAILFE